MKKICLIVLLLFANLILAQSGTISHNPNGLLYPDAALTMLKHIADSLQVQFQNQPTATYNAVPQGYYVYIAANGRQSVSIKKDIDAGLGYAEIRAKYPDLDVLDSMYATRSTYTNYKKQKIFAISKEEQGSPVGTKIHFQVEKNINNNNVKSSWLYTYYTNADSTNQNIEACYITNPVELMPLKSSYARLVHYSEYFIGSNNVYYDDAKRYDVEFLDEPGAEMVAFLDYANSRLGQPDQGRYEGDQEYYNKWSTWQNDKWLQADKLYAVDNKFKKLLTQAYNNTPKGTTDSDFEDYIWRYYSKQTALDYKRSRRIFGAPRVSLVPRLHIRDVAVLAAQVANWQVFMCAHLYIIDTDFGYPTTTNDLKTGRHTYVKELETLGINTGDLLIGMCLKINEATESHYYGNINDIGKILYEVKDRQNIAARLLFMIQDPELDIHNRIRMCYVFANYNYCTEDSAERTRNKQLLNEAMASIPKVLCKGLIDNDDPFYSEN